MDSVQDSVKELDTSYSAAYNVAYQKYANFALETENANYFSL